MFVYLYLSGCLLMLLYCIAYLFYRREFWLADLVVIPFVCLFSWVGVLLVLLVALDNFVNYIADKRKWNRKFHI